MGIKQTIRELDALIEKSQTQDSLTPSDTESLRRVLAATYEHVGMKKLSDALHKSAQENEKMDT